MFKRVNKLAQKREDLQAQGAADDLGFSAATYATMDDDSSSEEDQDSDDSEAGSDSDEDEDSGSASSEGQNKRKRLEPEAGDGEGEDDIDSDDESDDDDEPLPMTIDEVFQDPIYIDPSNPMKAGVHERSCIVCPAARLKSDEMIDVHIKSKPHHRRMDRFKQFVDAELVDEEARDIDPRDAVIAMDQLKAERDAEKRKDATSSTKDDDREARQKEKQEKKQAKKAAQKAAAEAKRAAAKEAGVERSFPDKKAAAKVKGSKKDAGAKKASKDAKASVVKETPTKAVEQPAGGLATSPTKSEGTPKPKRAKRGKQTIG